MRRRYYFDTSVFGGVFDEEFREESIQLFEQVKRGKVICLYSEIVERELRKAPERVKDFVVSFSLDCMEQIKLTPEATALANLYIAEKVVGRSSQDDCLHIAIATIHSADLLVSWNFKHIVNDNRIKEYNSVKGWLQRN